MYNQTDANVSKNYNYLQERVFLHMRITKQTQTNKR